jgi:hypothetical protein
LKLAVYLNEHAIPVILNTLRRAQESRIFCPLAPLGTLASTRAKIASRCGKGLVHPVQQLARDMLAV